MAMQEGPCDVAAGRWTDAAAHGSWGQVGHERWSRPYIEDGRGLASAESSPTTCAPSGLRRGLSGPRRETDELSESLTWERSHRNTKPMIVGAPCEYLTASGWRLKSGRERSMRAS